MITLKMQMELSLHFTEMIDWIFKEVTIYYLVYVSNFWGFVDLERIIWFQF